MTLRCIVCDRLLKTADDLIAHYEEEHHEYEYKEEGKE